MRKVWWPIMAAGCVIGVDLGGTKLLAGTVDSKLEVHHRTYRLARTDDSGGADRSARRGGAGGDRRGARRRCSRSGSASPAWSTRRPAWRSTPTTCPLHGVAVRDVLAERLGLPVAVDNDGNAAMLAEWRCGEARGAQRRDPADARAPASAAGSSSTGGSCTAPAGRRPSSATSWSTPTGRRARGAARTTAAWRRSCRVTRSAPRACGWRATAPDSALGRALDSGREITGALVTELAHDGDPAALRRDDAHGPAAWGSGS